MTDSMLQDDLDSELLLGRYRVVGRLGEGGMGTVHLARLEGAEGFMKPVVVKRMRPDVKSSDEGHRLFRREATILSKMHHPSILNIIDFGFEDDAQIMVLEYAHGYTLAPWLDYRVSRDLPLPVDICLYIVRKVLDALDYAHHFEDEQGAEIVIVHRDIAPDNVLINKKGFVHLLDFGVASMSGAGREISTKTGVFRGKLGYAAPETVHGHPATPRSDQYSSAVVLLELLTQETPFFSDSMGETIQRMVGEIPKAPSSVRDDVPAGLDEVVARALHKDPAFRFESAAEFSRELRRLQQADDEDVALALRELVAVDFELMPQVVGIAPLKARQEALNRELPAGPRAITLDGTDAELAGTRISLVPPKTSAPEQEGPRSGGSQRQLHGLLLALLVVGGLIAVGLGAAVALLSRTGTGEQVVVVGGDNPEARSPSSEIEALPTEEGVGEATTPEPSPPTSASSESKPSSSPSAAGAPLSKQQRLSRAVQSQSSAYQACFRSHVEAGQQSREATLRFSVPAEGGQAKVVVGPAAVASSSLGSCLGDAARQAVFPELGEALSFTVPVRARISHSP